MKTFLIVTFMKRLYFYFILIAIGFSCSRNPLKIDVSGIDVKLDVKSFSEDLLSQPIDSSVIVRLDEKYGDFFRLFTQRMIWIGAPEDSGFVEGLQRFASDTLITQLHQLVPDKINQKELEEDFTEAFRHYKYYFPEKELPQLVLCISGFNQSIVTAENLIGISTDKFLGSSCNYYPQLGLPEYKRRRMNPENIVPETMIAWAVTEFPGNYESGNLLSNMIYQGKLMYFVDAMVPKTPDSLKIGYTAKQLEFCEASEAAMWTYLAEHKLLYSNQRMDIKRYISDGPYTSSFTTESPGRTGVWLGWQIVRAYMKKNPEVSLAQLMQNLDHQKILNQSGYYPE